MLFPHSMNIVQQLISMYNTTVHNKKSISLAVPAHLTSNKEAENQEKKRCTDPGVSSVLVVSGCAALSETQGGQIEPKIDMIRTKWYKYDDFFG